MSIFHDNILLGSSGSGGAYQISRSLRFNSADSAYLSRTPAQAGNRKTWTWAGWAKRSTLLSNDRHTLFVCTPASGYSDTNCFELSFSSDGIAVAGGVTNFRITTPFYRDVSSWYHIVLAVDTTQATANNRIRLYVNGLEVTTFGSLYNPTQNADLGVNQAISHSIGSIRPLGTRYFPGYLADIYFIDGQALTPSSFGQTDSNGVWQPQAYTGTYGTNGFHLDFADNSAATAAALGKDTSGNGNNWTPNNFSVTAGAGNDSLVDTPTNYGTDTGAGGEVRGNYCTFNPLDNGGITLANGNLDASRTVASWIACRGTIGMSSDKYYWEFTVTSTVNASNGPMVGIAKSLASLANYIGADVNGWSYHSVDGKKYTGAVGSTYGATYGINDIIGVAFDADNGTLTFYKNGTSQGTAFTGLTSGPYFPTISLYGTANGSLNTGQRPFAYTAPSGYKALCTQNLPTSNVPVGSSYMKALTYTGTGTTQNITGLNFTPDLVWIKSRSGAGVSHSIYDTVRGATLELQSNSNIAETTQSTGLTSFGSSGFSIGTLSRVNTNAATYVAWCWGTGSTTDSNGSGSTTSQVRVNPTAGISIVSYTGNGTTSTVGHGLNVAPSFIIVKNRSNVSDWGVYHSSLGNTKYLLLNTTGAGISSPTYWNNTSPTSNVFTVGTATTVNANTNTYISYCFSPVDGFSSFGTYTGNGNADGPFVYTNHLSNFLLIKRTDTTGNWYIWDTTRNTINVMGEELYPNLTNAAATATDLDILSNGFKLRSTAADLNANAGIYVYASFATNPFSISRAR